MSIILNLFWLDYTYLIYFCCKFQADYNSSKLYRKLRISNVQLCVSQTKWIPVHSNCQLEYNTNIEKSFINCFARPDRFIVLT